MEYQVQKVKLEDEFKICPTCGYRDGFHSMFRKADGEIQVLCICPSCHDVFDLNLSISQAEKS